MQKKTPAILIALGLFFVVNIADAYQIKNLGVVDKNDFVLQPSKVEMFLDPGASKTKAIEITNRTGETKKFMIEVEDFTGSEDPGKAVILLGNKRSPYSLSDYIKPELTSFTLEPGQQMVLPIEISMPEDISPGGYYGSVLVSTISGGLKGNAGAVTVSRLGALMFVRVNGEVVEDGYLDDFRLIGGKNIFLENKPEGFELVSKNDGSVHLANYGFIKITNALGVLVDEIEVDPYFVMPDSVRYRQMKWNKDMLFGRYKAVASINRGYEDIVDEKSIVFWVIPQKIILSVFGGIVILLLVVRWISRNFSFGIKLKRKE